MWFFVILGVVIIVAIVYTPAPMNQKRPEPHEEVDIRRDFGGSGGI